MESDGNILTYGFYFLGDQKWTLIGDVVGNNDNVKTGKAVLNGKEYDYVFNIDIGDGIPALKLPYNNDQDPYHVAQVIIHLCKLYAISNCYIFSYLCIFIRRYAYFCCF